MFYAVLALTVIEGYQTSKHSGVIAFFDKEYIKTGIFSKGLSKKMHLAFEQRQAQDYGEFTEIDQAIAQEILTDARQFVEQINNYLESSIVPGLQMEG
jgi:uncharacterized protein (UPF0332 family)